MAESRTKKAILNIGFNISYQIVTLILGFISRKIFLHYLSVEYLGLNGLFSDVLGMLSVFDLGLNSAMVFSLYKPLAEKDQKTISAMINYYGKIYNAIALIVSFVGLCIIPFLKYIVNLDSKISYIPYYLIALLNVVVSYLFVYRTSILTADQKNYIVVRYTMITSIIRVLIQIIVLVLFKSFTLYLLVSVSINIINNLLATHKASSQYPYIKAKQLLPKEQKTAIFKNVGSAFIFKLSNVLMNTTDNIIISSIIGTVAVGLYSNYFMVYQKINVIFSLFFTSLVASVGNVLVTETTKKKYEIFRMEQTFGFMVSCIIVPCFFSLINDLIIVWLGNEYLLDYSFKIAITINLYLSCILQPLWTYREASGLYRKTKWAIVAAAVLNIILSILGGYIFGISGIIFASAASRLLTYFWYEPKVLFKEYFNISCKKYYLHIFVNLGLSVALICLINLTLSAVVVVGWISLLIKGVICFFVCLLITILAYCKTTGFISMKSYVLNIFKRH